MARHVVHGVLSLEVGGLERVVLALARIASRRGQRTTVVCIESRGALAPEVEAAGARVVSLDKPPGRSPELVARLHALLRELSPDVVHTHQIGALWYFGRAVRGIPGLAVVHSEHSDHVAQARGWLARLRKRLRWIESGRLAARYCCVSQDIADSVGRNTVGLGGRLRVVPNGVDTAVFADRSPRAEVRQASGIPSGARVIGTVGRLNEVKRQELLLRGFARVLERFPDAWLLLVGDGPERAGLEALAARLGIDRRTTFAGFHPRPERFLAAMDVFALTSRHEGLPLSILEAWAAGLPVVASAVGGIPGVVEEGVTGLLFPSGDDAALVDRLGRVLQDAALAERLSRAGAEAARQRHSLEHMADQYERAYDEAAALAGRAAA